MQETEFDRFADEYRAMHALNVAVSGEGPDFFTEYKIRDLELELEAAGALGPPLRILDFGSGVGNAVPFINRYIPAANLCCVDVSRKSLAVAASRFPGMAEYTLFDGRTLPFEAGRFDAVFSACVFHHIPHGEHSRLLQELWRVLSPGGRMLIYEHNPYNPLTQHAVNTCPFDDNAVLLRSSVLKRLLAETGLRECAIRHRLFFPRFLRALRPLERHLTWLPLGAQYYATGIK